jgi:hypothetical protein
MNHLIRLSHWEMIIADQISNLKEVEAVKNSAKSLQEKSLNTYREYCQLWNLYMEGLSLSLTTGQAGNTDELSKSVDVTSHPLLKSKQLSFTNENLRLTILVHHAYHKGDDREIYSIMKQTVALTEAYPHFLEERLNSYFQNVGALANICVSLNKLKEADVLLKRLKSISETHQNKINFKFSIEVLKLEIEILKKKGKYEEAIKMFSSTQKAMEGSINELDELDKMLFYFCVFGAYFGNGMFKNAQFYLQKIIASPHQELLSHLQAHARVLNLLLQYEQEEFMHLSFLLRSTYRYLTKKRKIQDTELEIINFLKKITKNVSETEKIKAFRQLKKELMPLSKQPFERNLYNDFPLLEWIESKIENKKLSEIMRERYAK